MGERQLRKQFQEQIDSVQTFVESELKHLRASGRHRNSIIGVENMFQTIVDEAWGKKGEEAPKAPEASSEEVPEAIAKLEERFRVLEEKVSKVVDLFAEPEDAPSTRESGETASASEATGPKRELFSRGNRGRGNPERATVGTQTEEECSNYLHTAQSIETLSYSIFSKVTKYLENHPVLRQNPIRGGLDLIGTDFGGSPLAGTVPKSGGGVAGPSPGPGRFDLPSLRVLSTPVSDPIYADAAFLVNGATSPRKHRPRSISVEARTPVSIPAHPLGSPLGGRPNAKTKRVMTKTEELAEISHRPISLPFSAMSPRSRKMKHFEYASRSTFNHRGLLSPTQYSYRDTR